MPHARTEEWNLLTRAAGCAVLARSHVEMTGHDRASLLHGLCTNDVKRLNPGDGCEAFLTNVQGKIIGYVYIFCGPQSLILESSPGEGPNLLRSLDRYIVREDVQLHDRSDDWAVLLISGPDALQKIPQVLHAEVPSAVMSHRKATWNGVDVYLRRTSFIGDNCWHLVVPHVNCLQLQAAFNTAGVATCSEQAIEGMRIEAGTPIFGRDISPENLPQEVGRDAQAISFTKGCYLGQETVARIDALGHVNRILRQVRFPGEKVPTRGEELVADGKTIGRVTSSCWSERFHSPLALAYLRRGYDAVGKRIATTQGDMEVVPPSP